MMGERTMEMTERSTDEPPNLTPQLLVALEHNFAEANGVRRLDQQLVYVPLAALGSIIYGAATNRAAFGLVSDRPLPFFLIVTALLVATGLFRNQRRHREILERRRELLRLLQLPPLKIDAWFALGRVIYFLLFAVGFWAGGYTLVALLPTLP
jgi:hypothetical protein